MSDYYIVKGGDTLWRIAMIYKLSVQELKEANSLISDRLKPGQKLLISRESPGAVPAAAVPVPQPQAGGLEISWPVLGVGRPKLPSVDGDYRLPLGVYTKADLQGLYLMARLVHAEARGEPYEGQVAVAAVLINRIENSDFPNTIFEAVYQPMQFEPVDNGSINLIPNSKAYEAVFAALSGQDPTQGALFFWNPDKVSKTSWVWTRKITSRIGRHVFGI